MVYIVILYNTVRGHLLDSCIFWEPVETKQVFLCTY